MIDLLQELVAIPAPPGQEDRLAALMMERLSAAGASPWMDAKGSVLAGDPRPRVVVTAHMDEIALQVTDVLEDGSLKVGPLGGCHPWKWGEGAVLVLGREDVVGVLGFGSIHTTHPEASATKARQGKGIEWTDARVDTGHSRLELETLGIRIGSRVCLHPSRRTMIQLAGGQIASPFLDDRADLAALLSMAESGIEPGVLLAATTSEETGAEGALWLMRQTLPEACVALEIGPIAQDNSLSPTATPVVWVSDSYAAMTAQDLDLVQDAADQLGFDLQRQAVSRGGSDATIATSHGLCARGITLAFAARNSHGWEVMHRDAPANLAKLAARVVELLLARPPACGKMAP